MAERGEYRSISRSLLSGKDFRRLPERPRWIFTVLKMNSGMVGLDTWYEAELYSRLSEESGATIDQVKLALDVLEHEDWIRREDNVVWVVGHLAHDPHMVSGNPKHRKSVQRHVAGLPRLKIVRDFIAQNADWFPKSEAIAMGIEWVSNGKRRVNRKPRLPSDSHSNHDNDNEDEKENERTTPASGESGGSPFPVDLCSRLHAKASSLGHILPYPRFRKALLPAYPRCGPLYPEPEMLAAIEAWLEARAAMQPKEAGYQTIERFAQDLGRWVRLGSMPRVDDNGVTERGRLAAG